ncbi:unnamed protein product [Symbiodinium natans]|uniref:Uncharacterized protein n=1 Tax=Symbiodinium natans TaxID=878477 RepID=A0A812MMG1_9DINO|nr:unnamed protein product [Symbiodinium natans]
MLKFPSCRFWNSSSQKFGSTEQITIGSETLPKHQMKQRFLRKVWQFRPWTRERACPMVAKLKLRHPYVSLLVRRGDKTRENTQPINVSTIVEFLDAVTVNGTLTREVFVGTDDCRSLSELKQASRRYTFKNLCGKSWELGWKQSPELKKQNLTDHYIKFFGELLAMSASDIFLGDHLSSVHHFVAYMRPLSSTEKSVFTMRKASSVW